MVYTKKEFIREANERLATDSEFVGMMLKDLPIAKRLAWLSADDRMRVVLEG